MTRLAVVKGHGTENDFVLLDGRSADLTPELVRALADRRAGIGADGVIRLLPVERVPDGTLDPTALGRLHHGDVRWFMDYWNADGSVAEMCGNGVRVLALFAERLGVWDGRGELVLGTRAGLRRVRRIPTAGHGHWYAVEMGSWRLPGGAEAARAGFDAEVAVAGLDVVRPALRVDMGNPHTVLALADAGELAAADLSSPPVVTPTPRGGTNVELVVPLGERGDSGLLQMRVHERGVGETRSCGSGACAAAVAAYLWAGPTAPAHWVVEVPGGTLEVRLRDDRVELAGPAVLVAEGDVDVTALLG